MISIDLELPRFLQSRLSVLLGEFLGLFFIESVKFWFQDIALNNKQGGVTYSSSRRAYRRGYLPIHQASFGRERAIHKSGQRIGGHTVSGFLILSYALAASIAAAPLPVSPEFPIESLNEMIINKRHTQ
jgi:hypothetical protein